MSLGLLPMLSRGAMHALSLFGSSDQKDLFLGKLISGIWSGTMNLTEPQAGSDLSGINCKAIPNGEHFLISGQKIYITWGDHALAENVVHLVLARIEGAPPGNNGISLFIVPKYLVNNDGSIGERNDLRVVGLEHKLGIHASPTCTMAFGDKEGAVGHLVGNENEGLRYMFAMMNNARLSVGHQGVAISERAYQRAVAYAAQRVQGRAAGQPPGAPIIKHPDVKRMLMQMRAITEGGRALSFFALASEDKSKHHSDTECKELNAIWVEILTPLVKGWCTEMSMEATSLGVQVHGGMGFVEESGAAQYLRDSRILPIYEGTNGIQALDFIGRKCLRDNGEGIFSLLSGVDETIDNMNIEVDLIQSLRKHLIAGLENCRQSLSHGLSVPEQSSSVAFSFLMLFGNTLCFWQLCRLAFASYQKKEQGSTDTYYTQKIATTKFFASHILSRNSGLLTAILEGDETLEYADEQYFNS
jgi:alkylation response protein AidB-like acyl-CoA dehydrogenase